MKTFREIKKLIESGKSVVPTTVTEDSVIEEQIYDDVDPEMQQKLHVLALDLMFELVARESVFVHGMPDVDKIARFLSTQFAGVDAEQLLNDYWKSVGGTADSMSAGLNPTAQYVMSRKNDTPQTTVEGALTGIEEAVTKIRDSIKVGITVSESQKREIAEAFSVLYVIRSGLNEQTQAGMIRRVNKMAEFGGAIRDPVKQISEVLTAADPASEWIKDFVNSKDKRFEGKSKKERVQMALGAYYAAKKGKKESVEEGKETNLTDWALKMFNDRNVKDSEIKKEFINRFGTKEGQRKFTDAFNEFMQKESVVTENLSSSQFDKIMVSIMNSPISEKFLAAVEAKNESVIRNLVKSQVKDSSKVDEVVDRVMRG